MGMFDTVAYDCPHCAYTIDDQTKSGPCNLDIYHITDENLPAFAAQAVGYRTYICDSCKQESYVDVKVTVQTEVKKGKNPLWDNE